MAIMLHRAASTYRQFDRTYYTAVHYESIILIGTGGSGTVIQDRFESRARLIFAVEVCRYVH